MEQHVHIPESDRYIVDLITHLVQQENRNVLEIGCGPARLLRKLDNIPDIILTGVDHDIRFVNAGKTIIERQGGSAKIQYSDIGTYIPDKTFDVVVSQGMHHHIPKVDVPLYLERVRQFLRPNGFYVVGDEFLVTYQGEDERRIIAVMWYSHVIAWALRKGHKQLATEEAKTLLDDLAMGEDSFKSSIQLDLVLASVEAIEISIEHADMANSRVLATTLLHQLKRLSPTQASGDDRLDLSRGDFKIHGGIFRKEVVNAGFDVVDVRWFGPIDMSGGMGVYLLKKNC